MKSNVQPRGQRTHEGAPAVPSSSIRDLRRAVCSCLLFEGTFYESGEDVAARITALVPKCDAIAVHDLAIEARQRLGLRHVPLLLCVAMARAGGEHRGLLRKLIPEVLMRADEPAELLALYWSEGRRPIAASMKRGIAQALHRFGAYQLAKYDRPGKVRLRDVLRVCHPKPKDEAERELWAKLVKGELGAADTWEVALSAGSDKRATWERLIAEQKLGGLALLRNLRNMENVGVPRAVIASAFDSTSFRGVLPHQFIAAARHAPWAEALLEPKMLEAAGELPKLAGATALLVDVSGSMDGQLSGKSEMTRIDAALGLAVLAREMCESVRVFTFSSELVECAPRRGFALMDAVRSSQPHSSTRLGHAVACVATMQFARTIVVTDEQSHDAVGAPAGRGYMMNVASFKNGVGFGAWTRVDGFSASVLQYVREAEALEGGAA